MKPFILEETIKTWKIPNGGSIFRQTGELWGSGGRTQDLWRTLNWGDKIDSSLLTHTKLQGLPSDSLSKAELVPPGRSRPADLPGRWPDTWASRKGHASNCGAACNELHVPSFSGLSPCRSQLWWCNCLWISSALMFIKPNFGSIVLWSVVIPLSGADRLHSCVPRNNVIEHYAMKKSPHPKFLSSLTENNHASISRVCSFSQAVFWLPRWVQASSTEIATLPSSAPDLHSDSEGTHPSVPLHCY